MTRELRVSSRNARFQQWESLLSNRGKRQRTREFVVQGVRPITLAAEFGWRFRALVYDAERPLSSWARAMLRDVPAVRVAMSPGLLAELGEKDAGTPELVAVVEMPDDDLGRIVAGPRFLGVVLDRPASPGNIGSIIRSADAFGADGIIVAGHAADVYDPGPSGPAPGPSSRGPWSAVPRTVRWPPGWRTSAPGAARWCWPAPTSTATWTCSTPISPSPRCCWSGTRRPA